MAGVFALGGVPALILVAATAATLALVAGLTAHRREWPISIVILCWLPALLLMRVRFNPRPEIFTLVYLGCFLALLWRVEKRPALAWLLPPVQLLWVNMQGLFILGPVLLGCYLAEQVAHLAWQRRQGALAWSPQKRRWWLHVGGASLAVVGACFVNPYFVEGARFPFDLYPKVASAGNTYKEYVSELNSPARYVQIVTVPVAARDCYFRCLYFLLNALPLSFVIPALWQASQSDSPTRKCRQQAVRSGPLSVRIDYWLGGVIVAIGLLVVGTLTLADKGFVPWQIVPLGLGLGGAACAASFYRRSRAAALVAGVEGLTLAVWMAWLHAILFGDSEPLGVSGSRLDFLMAVLGLLSVVLILYWGGSLFRLLVAGAFIFLGLLAINNISRFALVAGTIISWNLGEWTFHLLASQPPGRRQGAWEWTLRFGLASILGLWIISLVTDRFQEWTGDRRHFALRERPLEFAHDAVRFARQPGLPDHALVYDLHQACLFTFHNAPEKKPFLDGRLEMPDLHTFQTYSNLEQWLQQQDGRWESAVHQLGDPLVFLVHLNNSNGEASLMNHPGWRCIYFDALAAIFVPSNQSDLAEFYPTFDFADRHFHRPDSPSAPDVPGAAFRETRALCFLGMALGRFPRQTWSCRIPILLSALDRAKLALAEDPQQAATWTILGNSYWNLIPDLTAPPPIPTTAWDPMTALPWAQLTYCHRQAVRLAPEDTTSLRFLYYAFRARRMADAQLEVGETLLGHPRIPSDMAKTLPMELRELRREVGAPVVAHDLLPADVFATVTQWLREHRPQGAIRVIENADGRSSISWTWPLAETVGGAYLHLGRPADARRAWQRASSPPSEALLQCRLGDTYFVERDFENAARAYRNALNTDTRQVEACWGLALLHTQLGQADLALQACRAALQLQVPHHQRAKLQALEHLLVRYANPG